MVPVFEFINFDRLSVSVPFAPSLCLPLFPFRRCKDIKQHGQFNVKTMGSTVNVGLMAQKAEEYDAQY